MRQERKKDFSFREKFEDGVLRADACSERFSISRDLQYRTILEDIPSYSFGSSALRDERRLMRDAHRLISKGFAIQGGESLERFVARYSSHLEEEVV